MFECQMTFNFNFNIKGMFRKSRNLYKYVKLKIKENCGHFIKYISDFLNVQLIQCEPDTTTKNIKANWDSRVEQVQLMTIPRFIEN